jgi:DNA-binding response OmpR family regulator
VGAESILLVEDDPAIREMVQTALKARGFAVFSAENGVAALELAAGIEAPIQLLITDVVMPKLGGKELAQKLKAQRPEIKILYTSGYTENAIVHHGVLDEGINFLHKPYSLEVLAQKIRSILDA